MSHVRLWLLVLTSLLGMGGVSHAQTVLLIPGYLGHADNWRDTGIATALVRAGWEDGGTLSRVGDSARARAAYGAAQRFFTLELSSSAPLDRQVAELASYVKRVRARRPRTPLILVGHSAGGVLGRLYMVRNPDARVAALVTFASPHLGTELADAGAALGLALEQSLGGTPLAALAPWFGLERFAGTRELYEDLRLARPDTFLYWLNHQAHPPARYVSVVRETGGEPLGGDLLIPDWSQDLGAVTALRGRARTLRVAGTHALSPDDGPLLVEILRWLQRA